MAIEITINDGNPDAELQKRLEEDYLGNQVAMDANDIRRHGKSPWEMSDPMWGDEDDQFNRGLTEDYLGEAATPVTKQQELGRKIEQDYMGLQTTVEEDDTNYAGNAFQQSLAANKVASTFEDRDAIEKRINSLRQRLEAQNSQLADMEENPPPNRMQRVYLERAIERDNKMLSDHIEIHRPAATRAIAAAKITEDSTLRNAPSSPEFQKMQQAEGFVEGVKAFAEAPLQIGGEMLAGEAIDLVKGAGAAAVTVAGTKGLPTAARGVALLAGQGVTEGMIATTHEFRTAVEAAAPDIDWTDPEVVDGLFANREALEKAHNDAIKGGAAAGAVGALSTALVGLKLLPMSALRKSATARIANKTAQTGVQGGLGATGEAATALAAGREFTGAELAQGAIFGVAGGVADSTAKRQIQAEQKAEEKVQQVLDEEAGRKNYADADVELVAFGEELDKIYASGSDVVNAGIEADQAIAGQEPTQENAAAITPDEEVDAPATTLTADDSLHLSDALETENENVQRDAQHGQDQEFRQQEDGLGLPDSGERTEAGQSLDESQSQVEENLNDVPADGQVGRERERSTQSRREVDPTASVTPEDMVAAVGEQQQQSRLEIEAQGSDIQRNSNGKTRVFKNVDDLADFDAESAAWVRDMESKGRKIRGFYSNSSGKMHILTDNHSSPDQVRETALHEASHGIRSGAYGQQYNARPELEELARKLGGREGVLKYAQDNGIDMSSYAETYAENSPDSVHNLTEELIAQIHGRDKGELKQLTRRILSKFEGLGQEIMGKDFKLFEKVNGEDVINNDVQRMLANAERGIRGTKILGKNGWGILAPAADDRTTGVLFDHFANKVGIKGERGEALNAALNKALREPRAKRIKDNWKILMRTDGGLGDEAHMARVRKDGQTKDSVLRASFLRQALETKVNAQVDAKDRASAYERYNDYLRDDEDAGTDIPADIKADLDTIRNQIDIGSDRVARKVLAEQVTAKIDQLEKRNPDKYNGDLQNLVDEYMLADPETRDGDEGDFDLIPQMIKNHVQLMDTLADNSGTYMNTSYAAFNEKGYARSVMDDSAKREEYTGYVRDMINERRRKPLMTDVSVGFEEDGSPIMERQPVTNQDGSPAFDTSKDISMEEARAILSQMLENTTDSSQLGYFSGPGSTASINKSGFKSKHLEDPRMKKILGEYTDVRVNMEKTLGLLDGIAINHNFQKKLMSALEPIGLARETQFRSETGHEDVEVPMMKDDPMSVMNGYFTTPVIESTLAYHMGNQSLSAATKGIVQMSAKINYGKTILSPPTQVGNLVSNFFIEASNGHSLYGTAVESHIKKNGGDPLDIPTRSETFKMLTDYNFKNDPDATNKYRGYVQEGIVSESVDINELAFLLKDSPTMKQKLTDFLEGKDPDPQSLVDAMYDRELKKAGGEFANLSADALLKIQRGAEATYAMADDMFKIRAFEIELDKAQRFKGLSGQAARDYASMNVREGYLMYGQVNRLVKNIQAFPGVGLFVSFPAEMIRTAKNQVRMAARDMFDQDLPINVRSQRMAGMLVSYVAPAVIAGASAGALGMSDEQEEAYRNTLPEWQRQNDMVFLPMSYENGDPAFVDISRYNPYSMFIKAWRELNKANDDRFLGVSTNLYDAAAEVATPFIAPNILANSMFELMTGRKIESGSRITNPAKLPTEQFADRIMQFAWNVAPGGATQGRNIFDSAVNDKTWYGSETSLPRAMAKMAGMNIGRMDRDVSLRFYSRDFNGHKSNARNLINRPMNDQSGPMEYTDILHAVEGRVREETKNFEDAIAMVGIMKQLGLSDDKITKVMKSQRVATKDIQAMLSGEVPEISMTGKEGNAGFRAAQALADTEEERKDLEVEFKRRKALLERAYDEIQKRNTK